MWLRRCVVVLLVVLAPLSWAPARAQPACTFTLGFKALHDMIPDVVGECTGDQQPVGYGALQGTTKGILAWERARNITFFNADDGTVWINGPYGLQRRRLDEYFPWEIAGGQSPVVWAGDRPSVPVGGAPSAPRGRSLNELEAACSAISSSVLIGGLFASPAEQAQREAEYNAINYLCDQAVRADGEKGLTCFQEAYDAAKALARVMPGSTRATTAYDDAYRTCIGR